MWCPGGGWVAFEDERQLLAAVHKEVAARGAAQEMGELVREVQGKLREVAEGKREGGGPVGAAEGARRVGPTGFRIVFLLCILRASPLPVNAHRPSLHPSCAASHT